MLRRVLVGGITAVMITSGSVDLSACGDKFLRVGRSARFRGYAAVHPASILIYKSATSTPAGIKELESLLRRAGHTPLAVENGAALTQTFAATHFDLVIAEYADAGRIKSQLESVPSRPEVLPILYKPTKTAAAEAEKEYRFLLKPHAMNKAEALKEIDHVMSLRLNGTAAMAAVH